MQPGSQYQRARITASINRQQVKLANCCLYEEASVKMSLQFKMLKSDESGKQMTETDTSDQSNYETDDDGC